MRELLRGVAAGLLALALAGALASRAGWIAIDAPRPGGTGPWILARATGHAAFAALALATLAGLLISTRAGDRWIPRAALVELHGWLSPLALALTGGHALALLADRYLRYDLIDVVVPLASGYRPTAVGLGIAAAYLALVVHASFGLRRRLGARRWRRLHYLSFAAFAAAALHAALAGTDAARPWAIALLAAPIAGVGLLIARRLRRA